MTKIIPELDNFLTRRPEIGNQWRSVTQPADVTQWADSGIIDNITQIYIQILRCLCQNCDIGDRVNM